MLHDTPHTAGVGGNNVYYAWLRTVTPPACLPVLPSRRPRPLFPLLLPPSPPSGPADVSFSLVGAAIAVVDFAAAAVPELSLLHQRVVNPCFQVHLRPI